MVKGVGKGGVYHFMYFRWSFIITSMKSSTVAGIVALISIILFLTRRKKGSVRVRGRGSVPFSSRTSTSQFNIL